MALHIAHTVDVDIIKSKVTKKVLFTFGPRRYARLRHSDSRQVDGYFMILAGVLKVSKKTAIERDFPRHNGKCPQISQWEHVYLN